jgi:hypothetical protein
VVVVVGGTVVVVVLVEVVVGGTVVVVVLVVVVGGTVVVVVLVVVVVEGTVDVVGGAAGLVVGDEPVVVGVVSVVVVVLEAMSRGAFVVAVMSELTVVVGRSGRVILVRFGRVAAWMESTLTDVGVGVASRALLPYTMPNRTATTSSTPHFARRFTTSAYR